MTSFPEKRARCYGGQLDRGTVPKTTLPVTFNDFPLWYRCSEKARPYSAFIRAIIFLFAAFSFRLRRSLGFSKCW